MDLWGRVGVKGEWEREDRGKDVSHDDDLLRSKPSRGGGKHYREGRCGLDNKGEKRCEK